MDSSTFFSREPWERRASNISEAWSFSAKKEVEESRFRQRRRAEAPGASEAVRGCTAHRPRLALRAAVRVWETNNRGQLSRAFQPEVPIAQPKVVAFEGKTEDDDVGWVHTLA